MLKLTFSALAAIVATLIAFEGGRLYDARQTGGFVPVSDKYGCGAMDTRLKQPVGDSWERDYSTGDPNGSCLIERARVAYVWRHLFF